MQRIPGLSLLLPGFVAGHDTAFLDAAGEMLPVAVGTLEIVVGKVVGELAHSA